MRSYEDVAAFFDVLLCPSSTTEGCTVTPGEHQRGGVIPGERTIHWTPRRLNRLGLRRFLNIVARTRTHKYYTLNPAMRIYAENRWTVEACRALRIRLPRAYAELDRSRVRWLIGKGHTVTVPARRWAERRATHGNE